MNDRKLLVVSTKHQLTNLKQVLEVPDYLKEHHNARHTHDTVHVGPLPFSFLQYYRYVISISMQPLSRLYQSQQ